MFENDVRVYIYSHFLKHGAPPSVAEAAEGLGVEEQAVADAYRRLQENHVIVLHPGSTEIWMANPWSAVPTTFTVEAKGRKWWGSCIWDALGIIAMLGGEGRVATTCADCGEDMEVEVSGYEPRPAEGIIHFAVPAAHWWDDIGYT